MKNPKPKGEDDLIEDLTQPDLDQIDYSISSNLIMQFTISVCMIVLFLLFRKKAPWLYFPNILNRPSHTGYSSGSSSLGWIKPLLTVDDTKLLSLIGLDGFMLLQTIALLYRLCFIFSITIAPILIYRYVMMKGGEQDVGIFLSMSVWGIKDRVSQIMMVAAVYIISLFVFYTIYIYYKRYITLRQLYLKSPATMTSISKLKQISRNIGSDESALDLVNVSTKTCLITRLPGYLKSNEDLMKYIESLGIGEIESVSLVRDTYLVQKLYEERDTVIQNVEKEINFAFLKMKQHYKNSGSCKDSFGSTYGSGLDDSAQNLFSHSKYNTDEKVRMSNEFFESNCKFLRRMKKQTYLKYYLNQLKIINDKIEEQKKSLEEFQSDPGVVVQMIENDQSLFIRLNPEKDVSFFTFRQLFHFSDYRRMFTLDLPIGKKKAFVTLKDQKTTEIIKNAKIGSRVFSCTANKAPAPHDIIWKNLTKGEISTYFAKIISTCAFFILNLVFLYLVSNIRKMLVIEKNNDNLIIQFIAKSTYLRSLYTGFLSPLVYNLLLFFVPIFITMLLNMQGINSYSNLQIKMMHLFSLFLFFNGFLSIFIGASFFTTITSIYYREKTIDLILSEFRTKFFITSAFFFNTIVQRLFVGSAMVLLKPFPFIFNFLIAPFITKTRRQEIEIQFSPPMDFGVVIPNLMLIFPMVIVYTCINPIMLVFGFLFYFINYFCYKYDLFYATRNEFESGGIYWKQSSKFIIYSIVAFQLATAINIYSSGGYLITLFLIPIVVFTYFFADGVHNLFVKDLDNFAVNEPEEEFLDKFSRNALKERTKLLNEWQEIEPNEDEDVLPISDSKMSSNEKLNSFYHDPSTGLNSSNIILPANFYIILHYLQSFDSKNIFGLKKS